MSKLGGCGGCLAGRESPGMISHMTEFDMDLQRSERVARVLLGVLRLSCVAAFLLAQFGWFELVL